MRCPQYGSDNRGLAGGTVLEGNSPNSLARFLDRTQNALITMILLERAKQRTVEQPAAHDGADPSLGWSRRKEPGSRRPSSTSTSASARATGIGSPTCAWRGPDMRSQVVISIRRAPSRTISSKAKAPLPLPSHPASRLPSASVASLFQPGSHRVLAFARAEGYAAFFMRASHPQPSVIAPGSLSPTFIVSATPTRAKLSTIVPIRRAIT
jgi:hypothetical protein